MEDRSAIHARVYGLVQGVGFRYYTQNVARKYGLKGWVRNNPDGSVEVVAEGTAGAVQHMEEFLHTGPPHAQVSQVEVRRPAYQGLFKSFSVEF